MSPGVGPTPGTPLGGVSPEVGPVLGLAQRSAGVTAYHHGCRAVFPKCGAASRQGKTVAAYGAAAKGNTLMNYAGIRPDLIRFVVDRNPAKQGKTMPGSRIPIVDESRLQQEKPDYVVILPWNLKAEVMLQLEYIKAWGGCFVTAVPELSIEQ